MDIPVARYRGMSVRSPEGGEVFVRETAGFVSVSGEHFRYTFDRRMGTLASMVYNGEELLASGPKLDVWRAPLNNETDPWGTQISLQWRKTGLNRLESGVESFTVDLIDRDIVRIAVFTVDRAPGASARFENEYIYFVLSSGDVILNHRVLPIGDLPDWLARIGFSITMPPEFESLRWYGRGPVETYPDRKTGARIGVYSADVHEQFTPYLVPQDCCNKSDVRWLALADGSGTGLFVSGAEPLEVSVYPVTTENLSRALYPFQLKTGETITVNIDHRVSGVGGTPVSTLPKYRVLPQEYGYVVRLRPFDMKTVDPADLGRQSIPRELVVFP
jgi:beta-galactosidase